MSSAQPDKDEIIRAVGHNSTLALDVIEDWLHLQTKRSIDNLAKLDEITPEVALHTCHGLVAMGTLKRNLEQAITKGQQAAGRIQKVT